MSRVLDDLYAVLEQCRETLEKAGAAEHHASVALLGEREALRQKGIDDTVAVAAHVARHALAHEAEQRIGGGESYECGDHYHAAPRREHHAHHRPRPLGQRTAPIHQPDYGYIENAQQCEIFQSSDKVPHNSRIFRCYNLMIAFLVLHCPQRAALLRCPRRRYRAAIVSNSCLTLRMSHSGVEVAPQMPTLSAESNHSRRSSPPSSML